MKAMRFISVLFIIFSIMMLQACGGGGGTTDTAGALTISSPTSTDNKDGSFTVSATVTYVPPTGKTAQGVVVTTTATDSLGNVRSDNATLTSGSNSVIYSYRVRQIVGSSTTLSIASNIGGMVAGVSAVIPALTQLSATAILFKATDPAGTTLTTTIAGGIQPYSIDVVTTDALNSVNDPTFASDLTLTLTGTTLNVTINQTAALVSPVAFTATIVIIDAFGNQVGVPVKYFK